MIFFEHIEGIIDEAVNEAHLPNDFKVKIIYDYEEKAFAINVIYHMYFKKCYVLPYTQFEETTTAVDRINLIRNIILDMKKQIIEQIIKED